MYKYVIVNNPKKKKKGPKIQKEKRKKQKYEKPANEKGKKTICICQSSTTTVGPICRAFLKQLMATKLRTVAQATAAIPDRSLITTLTKYIATSLVIFLP